MVLSLLHDKGVEGAVNEDVNSFATKGYRALGVARTDVEKNWQFVGLIALSDPPRDDSAKTIKTAESMGITVKMVTGDHVAIAEEVCREVGLGTNIVTSSSILNKSDSDAESVIEKADGFAEVFPENKYHIVELLQKKGHIVCMTGDGVNDAPALKKADCGIAVAGATDAAKSAAAVVLTKPGLSVIIDAVTASREIFQRMTNYAIYRINETIRVLFFISLSIIVFSLSGHRPNDCVTGSPQRYAHHDDSIRQCQDFQKARKVEHAEALGNFIISGRHRDGVFLRNAHHRAGRFASESACSPVVHISELVRGRASCSLCVPYKGTILVCKASDARVPCSNTDTGLTATIITVYGILLHAMGWELAAIVWGYALATFVVQDFAKVRFYKLQNREVGKVGRDEATTVLRTVAPDKAFTFYRDYGQPLNVMSRSLGRTRHHYEDNRALFHQVPR